MKKTENNKLIAEFDGFSIEEMNGNEYATHPDMLEALCVEEELQYHSSWDWLMPVVEKIEQVCEGVPDELMNVSLFSEIGEVYNAVIEFIKWYNKNEK